MVPVSLGAADALVVAGGARFAAHAALLAAHSGYFRAALAERADAVLHAPDLSAQQFWPLLAYMYTGYLELSPENAYQVLAGAHLLRMPRALDLCRSFLGGCRPHTVVKPIASRKLPPFPPPPIGPPRGETSLSARPALDEVVQREPPCLSTTSQPPPEPQQQPEEQQAPQRDDPPARDEEIDEGPSNSRKIRTDRRVVLDVACCDGPVRFRRVLNSAYGEDGRAGGDEAVGSDSEDSYVEIEEDALDGRSAFDRSLQKQMNEDIRSKREGAAYACAYCNHAFKSQYCYQKHARRHLNPVSIDEGGCKGAPSAQPAQPEAPKREVRPLDMNVQYYPCKTCGSKFPSYYFVHKHRKLCHAEELEGEAKAPERKRKSTTTADAKKP